MTLPPIWKVRRELWRIVIKLKVALMRMGGSGSEIEYHGLCVPLHRSGMNASITLAIARGIYEDPEIRGLQRITRPGDRILELGSGLGIVTALAARASAPGGCVLSFEANPEMIPATREFLAGHNITNVELRNAVLVPAAAPGETRDFHLARSFAASSLLGVKDHRAREIISVPTEQLNDVVAAFRPSVLICDIEGGEIELLPALDARGIRAVVVEIHPDLLSQQQISQIHEALARHGLHPEAESPGGTVVVFSRINAP